MIGECTQKSRRNILNGRVVCHTLHTAKGPVLLHGKLTPSYPAQVKRPWSDPFLARPP
jgi:hypothetical protein